MEQHQSESKGDAVFGAEQVVEDPMSQAIEQRSKGELTSSGCGQQSESISEREGFVPLKNVQAKEKECDDLRNEVHRLQNELKTSTGKEGESASTSSYSEEIASLQALIQRQQRQISDLKATIDEAGLAYKEQREKIQDLQLKKESLEKALYTKSCGSGDSRLGNKEEMSLTKTQNSKPVEIDNAAAASSALLPIESDEGFKLIELESKIFELEGSLEAANKTADDLKLERDMAISKQSELSQQLAGMESGLRQQEAVKEQLTELETDMSELRARDNAMKEETEKLRGDLRAKEEATQALERELKNYSAKIESLESEFSVSKQQLDAMSSQKEAVESTLRQNLEKMLEMQRSVKETEKSINDAKEERDRISMDYEKRLQTLSAALAEAEKESSRVKGEMEELEKEKTEAAAKASGAEEKITELQAVVERMEREKADLEQLRREETLKHGEEKKLLLEKEQILGKLVQENDQLKTTLKEDKAKLETERRNALEESNRLRQELDEKRSTMANIEEAKLRLMETAKAAEEECQRLTKVLEAKEEELKGAQDSNGRLIAGMQQHEETVQSYKTAMQEVNSVRQKYEESLAKKNQELERCQSELQTLREKTEAFEKNVILEKQEIQRLQNDLGVKTELEKTLKADLNSLQTKMTDKCQEMDALQQQLSDCELRLQQSSQSNTAMTGEIEGLKSTNATQLSANETLQQEAKGKEARLAELDTRLATTKKQVNDLQLALTGKKVELEEATKTSDESRKAVQQLELRFRNAEDERSSLVETVRQLKAENEKLTTAARGSLQPAASRGRRGLTKTASTTAPAFNSENADEVEVTQMAAPSRKKPADETKKEKSSEPELPAVTKGGKPSRVGKKTSARGGRAGGSNDDVASDATLASLVSGNVSPKQPAKQPAKRKTRTRNAAAVDSASLPLADFSIPLDGPVSSTGRPQRRAAQIASNGIVAVNEFWRNSASADKVSEPSTTAGSVDSANHDLPPKKRRRQLLKDPTAPVCTPVLEEKESAMPTESAAGAVIAVSKKQTVRKKK